MRVVVAVEGLDEPGRIFIERGALYTDDRDYLPVSAGWDFDNPSTLIGKAHSFERNEETGEVSFEIDTKYGIDIEGLTGSVFCTYLETVEDVTEPGKERVARALIRAVTLYDDRNPAEEVSMNEHCKNCGDKILVSIFKGEDWCSDDCRKVLVGETKPVLPDLWTHDVESGIKWRPKKKTFSST